MPASTLVLLPRSKWRMQFVAARMSVVCTTATILWQGGAVQKEYYANREDDMLQRCARVLGALTVGLLLTAAGAKAGEAPKRSEEHTSELQSQSNLVCRLLLEK